jgi:hypothetical protein
MNKALLNLVFHNGTRVTSAMGGGRPITDRGSAELIRRSRRTELSG